MDTLYKIIVDDVFKDDDVTGSERKRMYRLLDSLRARGVALEPALDTDGLCSEENKLSIIKARFEKAVIAAFGMSAEDALSDRRRILPVIYRRRACYAVLVTVFGLTTSMIAKYFDTWHDRTTIFQSFSKHFDEMKFNPEYQRVFYTIKKEVDK